MSKLLRCGTTICSCSSICHHNSCALASCSAVPPQQYNSVVLSILHSIRLAVQPQQPLMVLSSGTTSTHFDVATQMKAISHTQMPRWLDQLVDSSTNAIYIMGSTQTVPPFIQCRPQLLNIPTTSHHTVVTHSSTVRQPDEPTKPGNRRHARRILLAKQSLLASHASPLRP
jgi:hypothetical protein